MQAQQKILFYGLKNIHFFFKRKYKRVLFDKVREAKEQVKKMKKPPSFGNLF